MVFARRLRVSLVPPKRQVVHRLQCLVEGSFLLLYPDWPLLLPTVLAALCLLTI